VIGTDLSQYLHAGHGQNRNIGHILSFVNEFDLVPRTDQPYARSLVDLFRSIYKLPLAASESESIAVKGHTSDAVLSDRVSNNNQPSDLSWTLPQPYLFHIGRIVILKAALSALGDGNTDKHTHPLKPGLDIRAFEADPAEFSKVLFCRLSVHRMNIYVENVQEIAKGRLNGGRGWNYSIIDE